MLRTGNDGACLVGVGARSPLGLDAPSTAAAVRAGIAAMADHPFMIDKKGDAMVVCPDAELPVDLQGVDRLLNIALPAANEALQTMIDARMKPRVRVFVGLPEERPGRPDDLDSVFADRLASALSKNVVIEELTCYPLGNAGGLFAMEKALTMIAADRSEVCLVGGIDSYLEPETLEWLDQNDQLHSESTIWGFCPGEGAGFCLLVSGRFAQDLVLVPAAGLHAAGSATEANRINTETVCIGEGLSEAFRKTLARLPDGYRVSHTICDMNGEPYRGNEYGFAMLRANRWFDDGADFSTPADCWGDMGAASGPLFAILAASAMKKGYSPGPATFVWASSANGLRAAALLQAPLRQG